MFYAINSATKEHRVLVTDDGSELDDWRERMQGWRVAKGDADGWIEFTGAECPVPTKQPCEIRIFMSGVTTLDLPGYYNWNMPEYKIIAYRPILNSQPEKTVESRVLSEGDKCEYSFTAFSADESIDMRDTVTFIGIDGANAVIKTSSGKYTSTSPMCLRPIRTDRERWIEAAQEACAETPDGEIELVYGAIYDAGLAKSPEGE